MKKILWADSHTDRSVPGGFLMRLWSQRFSSQFQSSQKWSENTKKNSPNSLTGPASHNSAQQPASIFLSGGALFPEVHTQIQVAAIVPEKMLFWEDKMLSTRYYTQLSSTSDPSSPSSHPQKVWSHQSTWGISTFLTHYQSIR